MSNYTQQDLCKIRTITTFLSLDRNQQNWPQRINSAANFCQQLSETFAAHGYSVQSIRIVTNPFGEYINTQSLATARADLEYLSTLINAGNHSATRVRFAIGEAKTAHEIGLLPELIKEFGDLCNACINIGVDEHSVLDNRRIETAVAAVHKISRITDNGQGNFNLTINFNCKPLIPYFPASYHRTELGDQYVLGLETPDLLVAALQAFQLGNTTEDHQVLTHGYYQAMSTALNHQIKNIKQIIASAEINSSFNFAGIDSSAAPSKDCASMVDIYKLLGVEYFGAAGTTEASALLTRVFKSITSVPLVGFSGLMLAVTEDTGLAMGTINKQFDIRALLTYSAVCGIGLDTVPIPGDTPLTKIAAIMRDTGTMAYRLDKPLTVRLFPVPGLKAGDITDFSGDDLCNCAVLAVP
ncbi:MAG: DUF711 family protein [Oceanospirillaceae bacterium]|nr:DUF711 family protein [Oceanospirillaceae bacterium]